MTTAPRKRPQAAAARLKRKLDDLKRSLLTLGPVAQGSILKRTIRRENPARPGEAKDYGPYYQWTRKIAAGTTIQNLTPAQARASTLGRYARTADSNEPSPK